MIWQLALYALFLFLAACATLPPPDIQRQVAEKALALSQQANQILGTDYACPDIEWMDGPCSAEGDTVAEAASYYQPERSIALANGITLVQKSGQPIVLNTIKLTTSCALLRPDDLLNNTLPHEIAHLWVNHFYGQDMDHDASWQDLAVKLGVPRSDSYITIPELKTGP